MIKLKRQKQNKFNREEIEFIPLKEMIGFNFALQVGNRYYISPAIFELMQDEEVKDIVLKQVEIIDVAKYESDLLRILRDNEF